MGMYEGGLAPSLLIFLLQGVAALLAYVHTRRRLRLLQKKNQETRVIFKRFG